MDQQTKSGIADGGGWTAAMGAMEREQREWWEGEWMADGGLHALILSAGHRAWGLGLGLGLGGVRLVWGIRPAWFSVWRPLMGKRAAVVPY